MAVFDDTQPWETKLLMFPHQIKWQNVKWQNGLPVPDKAEAQRIEVDQDEPLRRQCLHFLECIHDGEQPLTDGYEGLQVLKILNASQRSLDLSGRKLSLEDSVPVAAAESNVDLMLRCGGKTESQEYFAHPTAVIDDKTRISRGTKIWHFAHVISGSSIGENCTVGQNVVIGPDVTIGDGCKIQNNVSVFKGVTLEDHVFCGPSMVFTNVFNPRAEIRKMDQVRRTLVKKGATIGANATVICGATLGRYCFIGAGCVVNRTIPDHALVVGNPARRIGWVCECAERLPDDLQCVECGKQYKRDEEGLARF